MEKQSELQEEAIALLMNKLQTTEEFLVKEIAELDTLKSDNEMLKNEVKRLVPIEAKYKEELSQGKKLKAELERFRSAYKPYKTVKELKALLAEREKNLVAWKAK